MKAPSYAMPAWKVDGMDVARRPRRGDAGADVDPWSGGGPVFLELRTYRFRAHSMFDPDLYRDHAEVERWKERDPIDLPAERFSVTACSTRPRSTRCERGGRGRDRRRRGVRRRRPSKPVEDLGTHVLRLAGSRSSGHSRLGSTR
jgi:pyruvate dehydrogenase E1 component alpha subunit